jgi:hypothetical protein
MCAVMDSKDIPKDIAQRYRGFRDMAVNSIGCGSTQGSGRILKKTGE